jgi:hypothetical protein
MIASHAERRRHEDRCPDPGVGVPAGPASDPGSASGDTATTSTPRPLEPYSNGPA